MQLRSKSTGDGTTTFAWKMENIIWQFGKAPMEYLTDVDVTPSERFGGLYTALRLCRLNDNKWCIDRVQLDHISDLEIGEVLNDNVDETSQVIATYPLYQMTDTNAIQIDYRKSWYMIPHTDYDEWTIALSSDTSMWHTFETLSGRIGQVHLAHYYDHEMDISYLPVSADGREWCFPIRYEKYEDPIVSADQLQYLRLGAFVDYLAEKLSVDTPPQEGYPSWDEMESMLSDLSTQTNPSGGMFSWDPETQTMGPGGAMVGRTWVEADVSEGTGDGNYLLEVDHGNANVTAKVIKGTSVSQPPTDSKCWIPIYTVKGGIVTADRRGAFVVPVYE